MEIQTRQQEMKEIANHRSGEMDGLHTVSGIGELRLKHDAQLVQKDPSSSFADMLRDKLNQEGSVRFPDMRRKELRRGELISRRDFLKT